MFLCYILLCGIVIVNIVCLHSIFHLIACRFRSAPRPRGHSHNKSKTTFFSAAAVPVLASRATMCTRCSFITFLWRDVRAMRNAVVYKQTRNAFRLMKYHLPLAMKESHTRTHENISDKMERARIVLVSSGQRSEVTLP